MIFAHKHIGFSQNHEMKFGKIIKPITEDKPIVAICEQNTFLAYTISKLFQLNSIPHKISTISRSQLEDGTKIMDHKVPILIFSDQILQKFQILEFMCDVGFADKSLLEKQDNEYEYLEFTNRKNAFIEMAKTWGRILNFQKFERHKGFKMLNDLGISSEQEYKNYVLSELQNLLMKFQTGILKKSFSNYSSQKATLQNILFVDIMDSIERDAHDSIPAYFLRVFYNQLLELQRKMKKIVEETEPILRNSRAQVILDENFINENIEWPKVNVNWQRFLIAFGITSLLYTVFVKA